MLFELFLNHIFLLSLIRESRVSKPYVFNVVRFSDVKLHNALEIPNFIASV